ncbi:MAG: hypothetical protein WC810_27865 [Janthinobacterium sp.]|jgi:hypothetical protein
MNHKLANNYKGTIVEESLIDNRILNDLKIIDFRVSKDENPVDRWHLYTVLVTNQDIERLSQNIKPKWYMHFWKDREVIAVFQNKIFKFNYDDKSSWEPVVNYGLSIGIPKEQLDFPIE